MKITHRLNILSRSKISIFMLLTLLASAFPTVSYAKFVALVIGNGQYQSVPLKNPANDAKAIGGIFSRMGYDDVEVLENANASMLTIALDNFSDKAALAEVAVIYYAGHGVQIDGKNYAVPLDVSLKHPRDVRKLISQQELIDEVARASRFGLVILDACRDNPFGTRVATNLNRSTASRGLAREQDSAFNTVVAYATASDDIASDGSGANSPYTTALIENIDNPNFDIFQLFGRVRDSVIRKTNGEQQPFLYGSLGGERYYLHPEGYDRLSMLDKQQNTSTTDTPRAKSSTTDTLAGYESFLSTLDASGTSTADALNTERSKPDAVAGYERFLKSLHDANAPAALQTIPITISDLQIVSSNFESLRIQLQNQDWESLLSGPAVSDNTRQTILRIRENDSRLTYAVENVRARKKAQTIYAEIVVQDVADGAEFDVIPISANRNQKGEWSSVAW